MTLDISLLSIPASHFEILEGKMYKTNISSTSQEVNELRLKCLVMRLAFVHCNKFLGAKLTSSLCLVQGYYGFLKLKH